MSRSGYRKTILCLALSLSLAGCFKVKPGPYQLALTRYYRNLIAGATEENLSAAIAGVSEDLKKSPSDANLMLLRTNARLQLLRLGSESKHAFNAERAKDFFEDLRLLQNLISQPGVQPVWLSARVQTMFGDAVLIATQAARETSGAEEVREQIVRMQLFRLAADAYLRAGSLVTQCMTSARGNKSQEEQLPAMSQELDNARDGYVNAVTGMAQSEFFLRLLNDARQHFVDASSVNSGGAFPPASAFPSGSMSLFSNAHSVSARQAAALENLTPNDFPARIQFAESSLREEIAARLLSNPVQPVTGNSLRTSDRIALYFAGATLQTVDARIGATGDVARETIAFMLLPDNLYASARIRAEVPSLTVQAGTEKLVIHLTAASAAGLQSFAVRPEGILLSIQSRAGTNDFTRDAGGNYFLGRSTPLLAKDKAVSISGPASNVIVQTVAP